MRGVSNKHCLLTFFIFAICDRVSLTDFKAHLVSNCAKEAFCLLSKFILAVLVLHFIFTFSKQAFNESLDVLQPFMEKRN